MRANAQFVPLADDSVQCCVTSPPYRGLRKYAGEQGIVWPSGDLAIERFENCRHEWGDMLVVHQRGKVGSLSTLEGGPQAGAETRIQECGQGQFCQLCGAWRGGFGLEPTIEMYVAHTVDILREVWRVLRNDGVCFLNLGDSYSAGGRTDHGTRQGDKQESNAGSCVDFRMPDSPGIKPKDLCLIPMRVALAAQADGWWVRSVIIWSKPNPMPESVRDRPTDAFEYILMLTKSARYFWDAEAVKEPQAPGTFKRFGNGHAARKPGVKQGGSSRKTLAFDLSTPDAILPGGRNMRNVWEFATQPYSGAHFATFPEELPRRCIKAATSEKGACVKCGTPWERVTERAHTTAHDGETDSAYQTGSSANRLALLRQAARERGEEFKQDVKTLGWRPGCACRGQHGKTRPCLVLDPFGGSGTTAKVAIELGRRAVSLDLAYHELAKKRTRQLQPQLVMA